MAASDSDGNKDRIHSALGKQEYNVCNFYAETGFAQAIARSAMFQNFNVACTAMMLVWFSVDIDHNAAEHLKDASPVFLLVWMLFFLIFACSFLIRFMAFQRKANVLRDAWMVYDGFLVSAFAAYIITGLIGVGAYVLLCTQLGRVLHLTVTIPEMQIIMKGLYVATRSVFFVLCLWTLTTYLFALIITRMADGTTLEERFFSAVPVTMHTLLAHGIFMSGIGELLHELNDQKPLLEVVFLIYTCVSFTYVVIFAGVTCEIVSTVANVEKDRLITNYANDLLVQEFLSVDSDEDGMITQSEFLQLCERPFVSSSLRSIEVDMVALMEMSDTIFDSGSSATISFPQFLETAMSLREGRNAKVKDLLELRSFIKKKRSSQGDTLKLEDIQKAFKEAIESLPLKESNTL